MAIFKRETLQGTGLGFLGGYVDSLGFVALFGLFSAHVTGNFILIGTELARPSNGMLLIKLLAFPAFVAGVALTRLLTVQLERRGRAPAWYVLLFELILLCCTMAAGLAAAPLIHGETPLALATGILAAAAMGVQNTCGKMIYTHLAATTMMTGNVTQLVIDLVDVACGNRDPQLHARIVKFIGPVLAFTVGAIGGASAYMYVGFLALGLPIAALTGLLLLEGLPGAARPAGDGTPGTPASS